MTSKVPKMVKGQKPPLGGSAVGEWLTKVMPCGRGGEKGGLLFLPDIVVGDECGSCGRTGPGVCCATVW